MEVKNLLTEKVKEKYISDIIINYKLIFETFYVYIIYKKIITFSKNHYKKHVIFYSYDKNKINHYINDNYNDNILNYNNYNFKKIFKNNNKIEYYVDKIKINTKYSIKNNIKPKNIYIIKLGYYYWGNIGNKEDIIEIFNDFDSLKKYIVETLRFYYNLFKSHCKKSINRYYYERLESDMIFYKKNINMDNINRIFKNINDFEHSNIDVFNDGFSVRLFLKIVKN